MDYIKLHVFDFDGTLFRSPERPTWWKGGWWGNLNSLSPPCVPERPSIDWWNESVVQAAKQAIHNPDVMTILLTGRIQKFSLRLKDLLRQAGLDFDEVHLSSGGSTESYKMNVVKKILEKHPSIRGVALWDDRPNHLRMLADWVESNGRACTPHLITTAVHEIGCNPPDDDDPSPSRVAAKYKSKKKDDKGNVHYEYGPRQVQNRHNEKAKRIEKLRGNITNLRDKVRKDLSSKDAETYLPALAVALLDETYERVGNSESAAEGHYGVTGWRAQHLSFEDGEAIFQYVGKSGVKHEKVVSKAPVVKLLRQLAKGKEKKDRLLEHDGFIVEPETVNTYLENFEITAKDIRGFRANQEMCKVLREVRREGPDLPHARKERDEILGDEFKDALEEVAETVGHEPATLRSDYLVPGLEDAFLKDGTILATFKSATKTDAENEDEVVEKLVKPSPKKKPPREDLRKHRVDLGDDDTDTEDEDLSLNFKKVAERVAMAVRVAMVARVVNRFAEEEKETFEEWVKDRTFKHPETGHDVKFDSLPSDEQERLRKSHEDWEKPEDEEEEKSPKSNAEKKKQKQEEADTKRDRGRETKRKLREEAMSLEDAPAFEGAEGDHIERVLNSILDTMSEKDAHVFIATITLARDNGIDALSKGKSPAKETPPNKTKIDKLKAKYEELATEVKKSQRELDSGRLSEERAKEVEKKLESTEKEMETSRKELQKDFSQYYMHEALKPAMRNPMTFIGDTSTPLDKSHVVDRIRGNLERFKGMTSEDRSETVKSFKKNMKETQGKVTELEKKLSSDESGDLEAREKDQKELETLKNRVEYLNTDWRALEISSIIEGDEKAESRMQKGTRTLIKALHGSGQDVGVMLDAGIGIPGSKPDAQAISNLARRIKPEQMESALREVDPSGKLADSWKKIYDEDDSGEFKWPMSAIRSKSQRRKIENAHDVFVQMLTDVTLEDVEKDIEAGPTIKKPTKTKSRETPSETQEKEKEETQPYESPFNDAVGKLVKLNIKTSSLQQRVAARFTMCSRS